MKIPPSLFLAIALGSSASGDDSLVRDSEPRPPEEELAALHVPEGFEIHLFASEPQINKPINLAYDDRGRIWVSSTVEYPYAAEKDRWSDPQGTRVRGSRDAIKILEDTDGDGRADKVSDFADGLNIPTGVLPWHRPEHHDGCIAWSIPNIWYFADTTGDGRADHREVLFGPLGYEKDTHGMCSSFRFGPGDGWIYATHGFNNTSTLVAKNGTRVELHSGNVFRFRPDASDVEVFTSGQVNPFGLTFDRRGNLYSADCHSAPVYQLLQGGIYPSFGKPHDGLGFAPTMIEHTHGSTGICGIVYLDRDRWSGDWNDHVLIGNPVTSRINHDRIEFHGSTPVAIEEPDFVTSDDLWFRPVDLRLGGDGALYVADFYNRIIGHYEVPLTHPGRDRERGRIWRITKKGMPAADEVPIEIEEIADPLEALPQPDPFLQRRAAHQLQLQPKEEALEPLLATLARTPSNDTHLIHVLRMALRNHFVRFPESIVRDGAHRDLVEAIAPAVPTAGAAALLASLPDKQSHLRQIARHADDKILTALIDELRARKDAQDPLGDLDEIQAGLDERGFQEAHPGLAAWAETLATDLLSEREKTADDGWTALPHPAHPESKSPWSSRERVCRDGVTTRTLSSLPEGETDAEQRTGILRSKEFSAPEKLTFWLAGHRGFPGQEAHSENHVALIDADGHELHRAYPPRDDVARKVTWELEAGTPVSMQITDGDSGEAYAWLGITRIEGTDALTTDAFQRTTDLDARLTRLAEILKLSAPAALRERLKPWLPKSPPPLQPAATDGPERERSDQLIARRITAYRETLAAGKLEAGKGAALFKTNCATCHQIGHEGGLLGPQLDGIGNRGIERLAEDILDPNRNVDSHFHLTNFKLKDGTVASYFIAGERGEALQVRDPAGHSRSLQKSQIETRETLPASLMPATFGESLDDADFANLLEWLRLQS